MSVLLQEVAISNRQMNVSLSPDAKALDEVVMIGYGTTKKSDVTALLQISAETIRKDRRKMFYRPSG
jgi:hypothetical protein